MTRRPACSRRKTTMSKILFSFCTLLLSCISLTVMGQWNLNTDNYTTGRLSIGTASYTDRLSIQGTGWQIGLGETNGGGVVWKIGASGSTWAAGTGKFLISNNDASTNAAFVITNLRDVGIGVTEPKAKLHVYGGGRHYLIDRDLGQITEDSQGSNYILLHKAYSGIMIDDSYVMGTVTAVRGTSAAVNRKVTVEVNTASAYNSNMGSLISYNEPARLVYLTYNGDKYIAVEIANGPMMYSISFTGYANNETLQVVYDQNVTNVTDFTSLNSIILQAGNVGIGTKSPDATLTVNGNIHAKEVKVDLTVPAPDYVFEGEYNLRSLDEVEVFIKQQKHLPGIPSAATMEKNGIDVGEMNMLLLKKVEELTLYVIELKKEISKIQPSMNDR
jgi:hypothetical protein